MNSKIIPHNSKDGIHPIPIAVHPSVFSKYFKNDRWESMAIFEFKSK